MDALKELLSKCKCGVFITVNQHRNYYQSVNDKLDEIACLEDPPDISEDVRNKIIETDTVIEIQFYPDTPIGSYSVYHWDLDMALDEALECFHK